MSAPKNVITKASMMEKYFRLVWFARSKSDNPEIELLRAEVRELYPKETAELGSIVTGDWAHGFNSGMLACLRLLSGGRITTANMEEFPMLDS